MKSRFARGCAMGGLWHDLSFGRRGIAGRFGAGTPNVAGPTLPGFREPQGIAYEPSTDTINVANAGDGSVRLLLGEGLTPAGAIELGEDADNIRIDMQSHRVLVGYGSGALAVIDPGRRQKIADIRLKAHPESSQVEPQGGRVFVNVPDANEIAVLDLATAKQTSTWATKNLRANFPLAIDAERQQVVVMFRHPAKLAAFNPSRRWNDACCRGLREDVALGASTRSAFSGRSGSERSGCYLDIPTGKLIPSGPRARRCRTMSI